MWAFDSFQGLPAGRDQRDEHPRWVPGSFRTTTDEFRRICGFNEVPPSAYSVVEGFYEDTLSDDSLVGNVPDGFCLAYFDCDLYSSTAAALRFVAQRIAHGAILAFDDYNCWSSTGVSGDRAAFIEFQGLLSHAYALRPFLPIGWHGMSFVVEERSSGASKASGEGV